MKKIILILVAVLIAVYATTVLGTEQLTLRNKNVAGGTFGTDYQVKSFYVPNKTILAAKACTIVVYATEFNMSGESDIIFAIRNTKRTSSSDSGSVGAVLEVGLDSLGWFSMGPARTVHVPHDSVQAAGTGATTMFTRLVNGQSLIMPLSWWVDESIMHVAKRYRIIITANGSPNFATTDSASLSMTIGIRSHLR